MTLRPFTSLQIIIALAAAVAIGVALGLAGTTLAAVVAGLALLLVGFFYALNRPARLIFLMIALIALGQIGRIPPGSATSAVMAIDGVAAILLFAWMIWFVHTRQAWRLPKTIPAATAWAGFLLVAVVGLFSDQLHIGLKNTVIDAFYLFRLLSYTALAWIIPALVAERPEQERLLGWLNGVAVAVALFGFAQLYLLPNLGGLTKFGWDPHVGRLVSTFLDPNFVGGFFALMIAILGARFIISPRQGLWFWLSVLLILVATLLTYSRSGYLSMLIVLLVLGLRYSWRLLLISILVITPLALSIPRVQERVLGGFSIDTTSQDRILSWKTALDITERYPVLGIGYNNYKYAQQDIGSVGLATKGHSLSGSDSSLLNVLATTGVVGFTLFLATLGLVLRDARRRLAQRWLAIGDERLGAGNLAGAEAALASARAVEPGVPGHAEFARRVRAASVRP